MYAGYVCMAHHWLKQEIAAEKGLKDGGLLTPEFYQAKISTSHFYFENLLPRTDALYTQMMSSPESVMKLKAEHFSFDHAL